MSKIDRREFLKTGALAAVGNLRFKSPELGNQSQTGPHETMLVSAFENLMQNSTPVDYNELFFTDREFFDDLTLQMIGQIYSPTLNEVTVARIGKTSELLEMQLEADLPSIFRSPILDALAEEARSEGIPLDPYQHDTESKVIIIKRGVEQRASNYSVLIVPDPDLNLNRLISIDGQQLLNVVCISSMYTNLTEGQTLNAELALQYLSDDPSLILSDNFNLSNDLFVSRFLSEYHDHLANGTYRIPRSYLPQEPEPIIPPQSGGMV